MDSEAVVITDSQDKQVQQVESDVTTSTLAPEMPTKAKVMFEQVVLFELDPDEARDTEYLRKLLEPHYSAATDAKFEYHQEGTCLIATMIKQNPPKG
ncbi:MAG: hypothetical protein IT331_23330 [Anaerolineae bacterium]|nr:hypothetical protein [Anaerolineae bacterium]